MVALITALFVLLVGGGFVGGRMLLHRLESSFSHDVLLDPSAREASWHRLTGPLNYLLIGSDLRADNPDAGQRSDSIVIVQVDRTMTRAQLISIPRDLMVDIPKFPRADFGGSEDKINSAFSYGGGGSGGVQLLSATLHRLTGVTFDGAAVIDFGGFKQVIDQLGGIKLCVDTEVTSIHTGYVFRPGCHQMTGAQALDYSRQRYGLPDGDYDRQRHQQQLIKAIFNRAIDRGITHNPFVLDQFIRAVGQSLTVDTGEASLTDLLLALRGLRPDRLTGIRVPSYPTEDGDISYVRLDDESDSLFDALRDGDLGAWAAAHPQWVNPI